MKAIRYGLIFLLIITPSLLVNYVQVRGELTRSYKEAYYKQVLSKAIDAGTISMIEDFDINDRSQAHMNKERAVETFFEVIALNFKTVDKYERQGLKKYVPIILLIDHDGIITYSPELYANLDGYQVIDHVFHDKVYYSEQVEGQVISYNLNDTYKVLDMDKDIVFKGSYNDLKDINISRVFDLTESELRQRRQSLLVKTIENELLRLNDINAYNGLNGHSYAFFIPDTKGDLTTNTVESIGMMAIIQGMPMGKSSFNMLALSGSGLKELGLIYGYSHDGKDTYHKEACDEIEGQLIEIFVDQKEAARKGYYPGSCW